MISPMIGGLGKTTNYRVVLPFYLYAALGFLSGTLLLLFRTEIVDAHYFNPHTLAITHTMALAWGTMIVFGASHQLFPVMVEGKLASDLMAYMTFGFAAVGIPVLIFAFYRFDVGLPMQLGAILVNIGVLFFIINVCRSAFLSDRRNVHAWYVITAALWLFVTVFFGLLLVFNFSVKIFPASSVDYLSVHAHMGIVGWFVFMVIGVGSRLIPMFLISKYTNNKVLWTIFVLLNIALISFSCLYLHGLSATLFYIPIVLGLVAVSLFCRHCYKAYNQRIRKNVDQQMKTSLIAVAQMFAVLIVALALLPDGRTPGIALIYGFCIFFGWLTAIIMGMTFKTMPFIIWNKVYHNRAHQGKTPAPKELFNEGVYKVMLYGYLGGFFLFILGIILSNQIVLKAAAAALVIAALLYVYNVMITATHKSA
ncbi:MAG TPA: cytochrome C oxidase subunit I [Chitinophagaceae bacterium]|nr:cytochrome C oxidase subunit I [Chitinophagaceae bacterium]